MRGEGVLSPVSLGPAGGRDCSPHRAKQRLSAVRARDHPVMEIVPNKALSLSLEGILSGFAR